MTPGQRRMLQAMKGEGEELKFCTMLAVIKLMQGRRWEEQFTLLGRKYRIEANASTGEIKIAPFDN